MHLFPQLIVVYVVSSHLRALIDGHGPSQEMKNDDVALLYNPTTAGIIMHIASTNIIPAAEADDRSMIGTIYRTQLFFRLLFNSQYRLYWNDALCVWKHSLPSRDELVTASIRNRTKRHFPSVLVSNDAEIPNTQSSKKRPSVSGVRVLEERWH